MDDIYMLSADYHRRIKSTSCSIKRYLYNEINWNARLIGIRGARGVGKTTLLLQYIKEHFSNVDDALYASLDNMWFNTNSLPDLIEYASQHGIKYLFLDEIHHYPSWAQILKNTIDSYDDVHIVYTSSSMLEIDHSHADLSRRQTVYYMAGLSFREFLLFEGIENIPSISLNDLLSNHVSLAMHITENLKIIPLFEKYLAMGYYPFYKENTTDYLSRLQEVVRTIIDIDIPSVTDITYPTLQKAKTLLATIAENVPMVPKLPTLFGQIETSRDLGLKLLNLLDNADLLMLFSEKPKNYKSLTVPQKIYVHNTNIMYALVPTPDIGNMRETFFLNQLRVHHNVSMPKDGDFLVDSIFTFEVGGRNKKFKQIADIPNSYLAQDIEIGYDNKIALWMFGLLY